MIEKGEGEVFIFERHPCVCIKVVVSVMTQLDNGTSGLEGNDSEDNSSEDDVVAIEELDGFAAAARFEGERKHRPKAMHAEEEESRSERG